MSAVFTHIECTLAVIILSPVVIEGPTLEKFSPHLPLGAMRVMTREPYHWGLL